MKECGPLGSPRHWGLGGDRMGRLIGIGLTFMLLLLPGCQGCHQTPPKNKTAEEIEKEREELRKKQLEAAKPDFEARFLVTRPTTGRPAGCWFKPGHWTSLALEDAVANHFDFVGQWELALTNGESGALHLQASPFDLTIVRDVALAKGQPKSFESLLFVPPGNENATASHQFNAGQSGRRAVEFPPQPLLSRMPSYQYHFVVFARLPETYEYLQRIPSVKPPDDFDDNTAPYYRLAMLAAGRRPSLPSHANQWTSIACVLWDDTPPGDLDPAQQQAMLDWLHWGGLLILSGPDTLDALRGGFLGPYLPAASTGTRRLTQGDLAAINGFSGKRIRPLTLVRPCSGVGLKKHPTAEFMPGSGDLLVERRVGRGRIVASAFRLSDRQWIEWPGYDEIFNAFLLRRPPRKFTDDADGGERMNWTDGLDRLDAARVTQLRYFTRDTGVPPTQYGADAIEANAGKNVDILSNASSSAAVAPSPGMAAWNDFNPVAAAARGSLQSAARIEIPKRSFVLWVVVGYLIVLAPVNWIVFRCLRRTEWAWAAAPVIAVVCTGAVIRMAQLDIGFVRSRTELAVVEMQGDYPRAHVTRYDALYTSLATSYSFCSDDAGAVVLPFPTVAQPQLFRLSLGQQIRKLTYRRSEQAVLSGFPVGSNSTGLVHGEEMCDAGGGLSLVKNNDDAGQIFNRSSLDLHGVGLLWKTGENQWRAAWLGDVPRAKSAVGFRWTAIDAADRHKPIAVWMHEREASPISATAAAAGSLNLRPMLELAQNVENLDAGEVRLIGWSDDDLPGLKIEPSSPQTRRGILVVAHLGYDCGERPRPDVNLRSK